MSINSFFKVYPNISRDSVESIRRDRPPHRVSFARTHSDQPKRSTGGYIGKFELPFFETVGRLFCRDTNLELHRSKYGGWWRSIKDEMEFGVIQNWVQRQGNRVFMRDCLSMSVAMDFNISESRSEHTWLGALESRCKTTRDDAAINELIDEVCNTILDMSEFRTTKLIAAVPPVPGKVHDLPSCLAAGAAGKLGLTDLTAAFSYAGQKGSIKATKVDEKWNELEKGGLSFQPSLRDWPPVILIDDKYQSGITIQYVASRLRAAGAGEIYGLYVVKTLRDSDNS
jgi:hypothetical protein